MNKYSVFLSLLFTLLSCSIFAQTPSNINYQAALRNSETGVELSNQDVFLVVKFLDGGPNGTIVYQEEHADVASNLYGIINLKLGEGNPLQGSFSEIPWASGNIWLELEGDIGEGLEPIGVSKFSSVPYALYAADAPVAEPDGDGDSTNEIQELNFADNILTISNNENSTPIDLSGFVNTPDDDSDPNNEIQDLTITDNTLTITGNSNASEIDLTPYVNVPDGDSDPNNELITLFDYNPVTAIISIAESGDTLSLDLSTLAGGGEPDADADPTNEIQDLLLEDDTLKITNNDSASEIDLSIYRNVANLDNDPTNEIQDLDLTGTTLKITGNGSASEIDLSGYQNVANLDNDPTNEIQDLDLTGTTLKITGNGSASEIDLSGYQNVANLDNDPTNEIQDLDLTGTTLTITGNGSATEIDLSGYQNVANLDNDPTNEIQDLDLTGTTLKITGNGSASEIDLSGYQNVANLDNDPTNEIQDLDLTGNTLKITGNGSASEIDLSGYQNVANLDNDPTNEIQDLDLTGTTLKITGNGSASEIDLSGYQNVANLDNDPTNEIQDLDLTGTTLKITGNGSASEIDLSGYQNVANLDNDPTNEIQDLDLTGNTLKITGNGSASEIDLSGYQNVANLDNDPTNEIQDLSLEDDTLKITGNGSATSISLDTYKNQALPSGRIFIGNSDDNPTPKTVSGDASLATDGTATVEGIQGIPISSTAPLDGQMLVYDESSNVWRPVSAGSLGIGTSYYSVDPMDFVELTDADNGVDLNEHNSLKYYNEDAPFAMRRSGDISNIGAPVHLPHGATITDVKFYLRDISLSVFSFSLVRKKLENYSTTNTEIASGNSLIVIGNGTSSPVVNGNNVVNNKLYNYRILVTITDGENDDDESISSIQQAIYGVVIAYQ